jgi:heme/copper-type cytochrome/quinol oxidase subunit 2
MKRSLLIISFIALTATGFMIALNACKKERVETTIAISLSSTANLNVGQTATATITIVAEAVSAFKYYKVVNEVKGTAVDLKSALTQVGKTYTYEFSYVVQEFDDLHTLGFEFEVTDDQAVIKTTALVVNTTISLKSTFVKYDWKVSASTWLDGDVLSAADAAIVYRFNEDGTYQEDLSSEFAGDNHHFCYWAFKNTPNNGDTIAVVRLIRRLKSGDTAMDEYYDYRITSANESTMTMYWDIAVWGLLDIKNTFQSQAKGAFQPYGTAAMETAVNANAPLSCSNIDDALLTIP